MYILFWRIHRLMNLLSFVRLSARATSQRLILRISFPPYLVTLVTMSPLRCGKMLKVVSAIFKFWFCQYIPSSDLYRDLCWIKANVPMRPQRCAKGKGKNRQYFFRMDYDIVLLFGLTELKAQIAWKENVSLPNLSLSKNWLIDSIKGVEKRYVWIKLMWRCTEIIMFSGPANIVYMPNE